MEPKQGKDEATTLKETQFTTSAVPTRTMVVPVLEEEMVNSFKPTSNSDGTVYRGGLYVGRYSIPIWTTYRSWLKYDISHISKDFQFTSAKLFVYLNNSVGPADSPIDVHFSSNDSWNESAITWDNQPSFDAVSLDSIDRPASPDMFVNHTWYSWDVTTAVNSTLAGDGVLSLVLKQQDETETSATCKYFTEHEVSTFNASYIALYYTPPTTTQLTVDGEGASPEIDYIQNSTPAFGWQFDDPSDYQQNYEVKLETPTGDLLYEKNNTDFQYIFDIGTEPYAFPFWRGKSMRIQFTWPETYLSRSGYVDKIYFDTDMAEGETFTVYNLTVLMLNKPNNALTTNFTSNYEGKRPTIVLQREEYTCESIDGRISIDIDNTFYSSNKSNLLIEIRYTDMTGTFAFFSTRAIGATGKVAYNYNSAFNDTAMTVATRDKNLAIEYTTTEIRASGSSYNAYPFQQDEARFQWKYNRSLINKEGYIDKLIFGVYRFTSSVQYENFTLYLAETPVTGNLDTVFANNYGGVTPTLVLQRENYTIHGLGDWIVIDIDNVFYYNNKSDLLIDLRFDARYGNGPSCIFANYNGGYRAYNVTHSDGTTGTSSYATYDFAVEMIYPEDSIVAKNIFLTNQTEYVLNVRTCDGGGIWSDWSSLPFRYMKLENGPYWQDLTISADPAELGTTVTISINATHPYGVFTALIQVPDGNHTMSHDGDIFSYSFTASQLGEVNFTILLQDTLTYWREVRGSFQVVDTVAPTIDHPPDISYTVGDTGNTISWTPSDHTNGTYAIYVDDELVESADWNGPAISFDADGLAVGMHNVTIVVSDDSGNSVVDTVMVTVNEVGQTPTTATTPTTPPEVPDTTIIALIILVVILVLVIVVVSTRRRS